jgi:hypothetical protein
MEKGALKKSIVRELRAAERFAVRVPVHMKWQSMDQRARQGRGLTRDISTRGMYVFARSGPAKGRRLQFEMELSLSESLPPVRFEGTGQVVRIERPAFKSQRTGFAVVNLGFRLREAEKNRATPALTDPGAPTSMRALPKRFAIERRRTRRLKET